MKDFTLSDLVNFTKHEQEWIEEVFPVSKVKTEVNVSEESLAFLKGFSKSLSVKDSARCGKIKLMLN